MNNKKKIMVTIAALLVIVTTLVPLNTSAATYTAYHERGKKNVAYSKNIITYSTDYKKILNSDTAQTQSGFFVRNKGVSKVKSLSSSKTHTYNMKNEFLAGAEFGGVKLGFTNTKIDQGTVRHTGKASWKLDI
ncbi:hypothetical protein ABER75_10900 [Niallia taxi]|uniref:hypothetical protein n=1 Tax=Niallia taxi TaxID=2499688 RepID=UPI00203BF411|nr:hypothetical protein [Niallia taxi]MCM3217791.1 hypothetical protein [Niallia taxi]